MADTIIYCGRLDKNAMGALYKNDPNVYVGNFQLMYKGNTDISAPLDVAFYPDIDGVLLRGTVKLSPSVMKMWRDELTPMGTFVLDGITYKYAISYA